jgi:outer membrane protein assembly factor BamB
MVVHVEDVVVPNHNVLAAEGRIVYADSNGNRVVAVDRESGRETASVTVPGEPAFARGLARLEDDVYLVGSQRPLAIHAVDLRRGEVVSSHELEGGETETVYAVALVPPSFARPGGQIFRAHREGVTA